jgi:hypothetical protein
LAKEAYVKSRGKMFVAFLFLLGITAWLGSPLINSPRPNIILDYAVGLPWGALMAFVLVRAVLEIVKPQRLELDDNGLSLTFPWTGKCIKINWKDVSEVKTLTGPNIYGIWLRYNRPDERARTGYFLPSGWEDIDRDELVARINELRGKVETQGAVALL